MKNLPWWLLLAVPACAPPAAKCVDQPAQVSPSVTDEEGPKASARHEHEAPPPHAAHGPDHPEPSAGPAIATFPIAAATSDEPIHPEVLHEDDELKLAVVTIQPGATMSEHATPVPVTVQTIAGTGTMTVAGEPHPLAVGQVHRLGAGAPHALVAAEGAPLVVLVHYLKREGVAGGHAH